MALLHHDMTGTQTDCEKPLSRKKLKRLMPNNPGLTSRNLREVFNRSIGPKAFSLMKKKRLERSAKRKLLEKKTLPDGTTYQLVPTAAELEVIKPTMFERLGSLFGNLRKLAEREKAKGK
jgi:hypothetical protein